MRVVVTRPEHSGQKTAARLQALGHQAIQLPLSQPIHNIDAIKTAISQPFASLAITSAEALSALGAADYPKELLALPILVVGEPSGIAARDFGFSNIHTADGYATGMIKLLADFSEDQRNTLSPVLYLAGVPRGTQFEEGLSELNIGFQSIDAYQMQKCHYSEAAIKQHLALEPPDAVLFFSSEAVSDYFKLLTPHVAKQYFTDVKFLCISEKVASHLPKALSSQSVISKETSEQGIIDLLHAIPGT